MNAAVNDQRRLLPEPLRMGSYRVIPCPPAYPSLNFLSPKARATVMRSEILNDPLRNPSWLFNDPRNAQLVEVVVETHGDDMRKNGPAHDPVPAAVHELRAANINANLPSFNTWLAENNRDPNSGVYQTLAHDLPETLDKKKNPKFRDIYGILADIWNDPSTFPAIQSGIEHLTDAPHLYGSSRLITQEEKSFSNGLCIIPVDQQAARGSDKSEQISWDVLQLLRGNMSDPRVLTCLEKARERAYVTRFPDTPEIAAFYAQNLKILERTRQGVEMRNLFIKHAQYFGGNLAAQSA